MKLNLGCGHDKKKGYINIDNQSILEPDMLEDIRYLSFEDNSIDEIISNQTLEHLEPEDIHQTLLDWIRILKIDKECFFDIPTPGTYIFNIHFEMDRRYNNILENLKHFKKEGIIDYAVDGGNFKFKKLKHPSKEKYEIEEIIECRNIDKLDWIIEPMKNQEIRIFIPKIDDEAKCLNSVRDWCMRRKCKILFIQ